jgi:hypothetical protein
MVEYIKNENQGSNIDLSVFYFLTKFTDYDWCGKINMPTIIFFVGKLRILEIQTQLETN